MKIVVSFMSLILAATLAHAETIELKNGTVIQGKILSQSLGTFKVKSAMRDVDTYYLFEIKSIDGQKPSMEDPFVPLIHPQDTEPTTPSSKIYFQDKELFSLILPKDYQWFELPQNITIMDPSDQSSMILNFSPYILDGLSAEQKQRILQSSVNQTIQLSRDQLEGVNFTEGIKAIGEKNVVSSDFLMHKRGKLFYSSFIAFFEDDYLFTITIAAQSVQQRYLFTKILETIEFSLSTVDEYLQKGKDCLNFGQFELSQKLFAKVLKREPNHIEANYLMGVSLFKEASQDPLNNESFTQSEKYLLKALQLNPHYIDSIRLLGFYYTNRKQFGEANLYFEKYLKAFPKDSEVLFRLGVNYDMIGKTAEAIPVFERCLAIEPENLELYLRLASCHAKVGQFEKALTYTKEGKALSLKSMNIASKKVFDKIEKKINDQIFKLRKKENPGIILIYYFLIAGFAALFFKGLYLIKRSVSDVDPEFKEEDKGKSS